MRRLFVVLALLASLHAVAQSPIVRAHFEPAGDVMVGQPVRLVVEVLVPNYFTGAPGFPEFEIENAIVVLPQDRPEHSSAQINGVSYAGISQTYAIYPQQAGSFQLPAVKFSVPYAIAPPKSTTAEVSLPALTFHANVPAAARGLPYFLPTTQLTMTQHFSRPLKDLQTGDTVERTITVTAAKTQAMLIPPLTFEQRDGIRVYQSEPRVNDQKTPRGDFIDGQRVQTARYFIEKPGNYTLPAINLTWWNLNTNKPVTVTLSAVTFSAVAGPGGQTELPPPPEPVSAIAATAPKGRIHYRAIALKIIVTVLLIVIVWLATRFTMRLHPHVTAWIERAKNSERARFRSLLDAARENDAVHTYERMLRWFEMVSPGRPLDQVVSRYSELALAINSLTAAMYSNHRSSNTWSGEGLRKQLRSFRQDLREQQRQNNSRKSLAPLNPAIRRQRP